MPTECPLDCHICDRQQCIDEFDEGSNMMPCEIAAAGVAMEINGIVAVNIVLGKETNSNQIGRLSSRIAKELCVNHNKLTEKVAAYVKNPKRNPLTR